uniref:Uncharacterized protein n=1 Tax=Sphaerodactylus townsendi TaxID=933632 RepID=A0ACB8FQA3_9SAUR
MQKAHAAASPLSKRDMANPGRCTLNFCARPAGLRAEAGRQGKCPPHGETPAAWPTSTSWRFRDAVIVPGHCHKTLAEAVESFIEGTNRGVAASATTQARIIVPRKNEMQSQR